MELSHCTMMGLTLLGIVGAGATFLVGISIRSRQERQRRLYAIYDKPTQPKNELPSKIWNVTTQGAVYAMAASLLIGVIVANQKVTVVPCGKGELAIIGKPFEPLAAAVSGCDCCGEHMVAQANP